MIALRAARTAVCLLLLGCATTPSSAPLPEEPLVFLHRTLAQGRDRADRLKRLRGEKGVAGQDDRGVMKLNELDDLVDRMRGEQRQLSPDLQGRLAFFWPRTREIEVLDAFVAGTVACDWSQDRTRLLVASRQRGMPQLLEYSTERRDVAIALPGDPESLQLGGAYGPDGRIGYVTAARGESQILLSLWVSEANARGTRQLTPGPNDTAVRWSPDGRVVLFQTTLQNGAPVIKALDVDDALAEPRVIARGSGATFSPLGDWVVYSRERGPGWRLWRMRPDGTGKTALGARDQGEADELHPTVSPDGNWVAYVAEHDDRQQIRIRAMDGTGDRLLIEGADGTMPVW